MVALLCCSCPVLFQSLDEFWLSMLSEASNQTALHFQVCDPKGRPWMCSHPLRGRGGLLLSCKFMQFQRSLEASFLYQTYQGNTGFFSSITQYETRIQLNIQGPDTAGNQESSRRRKLGPSLQEGRLMAANAERKLGLSMLFSWQDFKSARMRKSACCVAQSAAFFRIYCVVSDQAS